MKILNYIKSLIKSDNPQKVITTFEEDPNTYDFHEDYYCQIAFLPKENFSSALQVASEIAEHSEKTFDGYGWTGCYVRNEADVPTKSKNYSVTEFSNFLTQFGFWECPKVTTGYSTKVIPCNDTRAFKKQSIIILFDFEGDIVQNVWQNFSPLAEDNEIYKTFLQIVATKYDFLLADWWKSVVVDISNPAEIEKYFAYDE